MALFSSAKLLCVTASLLVVVVSGTSHYGYEYGRARQLSVTGKSGGIFNRYYDNAARAMQVDSTQSCAVSGAHEVCHTAELESDFPVHVCPKDGKIISLVSVRVERCIARACILCMHGGDIKTNVHACILDLCVYTFRRLYFCL